MSAPGYIPAPTPPTRIVLPDGSKLSGDVALNAGNNVGISKQGNGGLIFANPPGPRRPLSVFAPGAITARTLQKATIPSAVLQQLDVFLLGAPVGVSGAACGNVVIAGTVSGSATLPLSTAVTEFHLSPKNLAIPTGNCILQTYPGAIGNADTISAGVLAYPFTPTADITVFNLGFDFMSAPNGAGMLRFGICQGSVVQGLTPTVADPLRNGNGYVTGIDGVTPCWFEVDVTTIPTTQLLPNGLTWPLPGNQGFKFLQGVDYCIVLMRTDGAGNPGTGNAFGSREVPAGFGPPIYNGNVGRNGREVRFSNVSGPNWGNWQAGIGIDGGSWQLYGSIVGLVLTGLVQVSTTLTGAPATPGSDVEIYAQF